MEASVLAPWCDLLNRTKMLDAEELFVACRTFKAELDDVADEVIRRRSREIIVQHHYDKARIQIEGNRAHILSCKALKFIQTFI